MCIRKGPVPCLQGQHLKKSSSTGPFRSGRNVWPADGLLPCSTCLTLGSSTCWGWTPGRPLTGSSQQMSTDPQVLGPGWARSIPLPLWFQMCIVLGTDREPIVLLGLPSLLSGLLCPVTVPPPSLSSMFLLSPFWILSFFAYKRIHGHSTQRYLLSLEASHFSPPLGCFPSAYLPELKIHNA